MAKAKSAALAKGFSLPAAPKRSAVPAAAADHFVSARAGKAAAGAVKRVVVYLPADLAKRLRVRCAEDERSMSDGAQEAIRAWLK